MTDIVKQLIPVGELQLGMHVVELDRPWLETNFLLQGFIIQDQTDIDALVAQCEYVYIEGKVNTTAQIVDRRKDKQGLFPRKTAFSEANPPTKSIPKYVNPGSSKPPALARRITYINKIGVEKELVAARGVYSSSKECVKNIMEGIRIGRVLDMNQARETVNSVVDSILENSNALVWLTKIKDKDDYTAEHSLNVCILSIAFARHLGHDEGEIRKIGLGGLLHDVGKSKIPTEILTKPGRFNDEEYEIMKQHPLLGRDLLAATASTDHSSIDIAYAHHERIDGKGYPRGLLPHQIPYYAKIIALTDTYDAVTSNRCYDKGRASMDALDIIYQNKGTQFDEELAVEFIKCIGIYPPGSIVEMTNHQVGIVIAENPASKLKPKVIMIMDGDRNWHKQYVVDLKLDPTDSFGKPLAIAREIPNGTYGIDIREFIKNGLVLN